MNETLEKEGEPTDAAPVVGGGAPFGGGRKEHPPPFQKKGSTFWEGRKELTGMRRN